MNDMQAGMLPCGHVTVPCIMPFPHALLSLHAYKLSDVDQLGSMRWRS